MPKPYGKGGAGTRMCAFYQQGKCDRRNCAFSHGDGKNNNGGNNNSKAPAAAVPKTSSVLVALLRLLFQKEQFTIFNADEGRLNLTAFKTCPDVSTVQESIDFNTAAFCEALCETIQSCLGNQMTILQLDGNDIRTFKHLSSSLMHHNLHSSIVSLSIANNGIATFDVLGQLKHFDALRELVLSGNPISNDPKSLQRVRHTLPNLLDYNRASVVRPPLSLPWPLTTDDVVRTPDQQGLIAYLDERFFSRINCPPGSNNNNQIGGGSSVVDGLAEVYHPRAIFTMSFAEAGHAAGLGSATTTQQQNKDATRDINQLRQKQSENNHNICKGIKQTSIVKGKIEVLAKMSNVLYPSKNFYFEHIFSPSIQVSFINGGAMSGGVSIATVTVHGAIRYQHKIHASCTCERVFHRTLVLAQDNGVWLITNDTIELRPQSADPIFVSFSFDRSAKVSRKVQALLGPNCGNGMSPDVAQAAALVCTSDSSWLEALQEIGMLDVAILQEAMSLTNNDARSAIRVARVVARSYIAARQAGNTGGLSVAESLQRLVDGEWNVEAVMPL